MIDRELIKKFIQNQSVLVMPYKEEAKKLNDELTIHSEGRFPEEIIKEARPNETDAHIAYRRLAYVADTKAEFGKITNAIKKIRRADSYGIQFPDQVGPFRVEDSLEAYCTTGIPQYKSLEKWVFDSALIRYLDDPNGVYTMIPREILEGAEFTDGSLLNPCPLIFSSTEVVHFTEDVLLIVDVSEHVIANIGDDVNKTYMFYDEDEIVLASKRTSKDNQGQQTSTYSSIEYPAFGFFARNMSDIVIKTKKNSSLRDSIISPVLPRWKEAIRRYSDHQLNMVLHLHPDRWEMTSDPCKTCDGKGRVSTSSVLPPTTCDSCSGSGYARNKTPFGLTTINPMKISENSGIMPPMPPAGYIERDIATIEKIKEEYKDRLLAGLDAIGLKFLSLVPLTNSGVSKDFDRQEINDFLYNVAKHLLVIYAEQAWATNEWRYSGFNDRDQNLPSVRVPSQFDVLSLTLYRERAIAAVTDSEPQAIRDHHAMNSARKELGEDSVAYKKVRDAIVLNPLNGKTDEEISAALMDGRTTLLEATIATKINSYLDRAYYENNDFYDDDYSSRVDKIKELASADIVPPTNLIDE